MTSNSDAADAKLFLSMLDLTLLDEWATAEAVVELCQKASHPIPCAAVCVESKWVGVARAELQAGAPRGGVKVATVINFPQGQKTAAECVAEISEAREREVDELDFCISPNIAMDQDFDQRGYRDSWNALASYVSGMVALAAELPTKVILQTDRYSDADVEKIAEVCILRGVTFLKTCTGKGDGATVEAVRAIARAVKKSGRRVGIKVSGGVKTLDTCREMLQAVTDELGPEWADPALFRIGASSLYKDLVRHLDPDNSETSTQAEKTL